MGRGLPHPRPQRVGRLSEALIEVGTAPAAGDMDEVAVEHRPFALVLVQAEIEELAQKSAALRRAESIRVPDLAGAGVVRPRQFAAENSRSRASPGIPGRLAVRRRSCRRHDTACRERTPRRGKYNGGLRPACRLLTGRTTIVRAGPLSVAHHPPLAPAIPRAHCRDAQPGMGDAPGPKVVGPGSPR